jgi:transcriptional regulator of acetoin/glycerol metabolism
MLRRLAALTEHDVVTIRDLPLEIRANTADVDAAEDTLEDAEVARIRDAIGRSKTMNEAARRLGMGRSTLYRHIERMELRISRTLRRD